ncbi:uncharacterized protein MELLADRAFT_114322 [Melampsora larici-populina 98AG31]|uniref:Uncharacterized protein n=1 Tax=Melampsora larici-populina (strain 98AG31 / pathotype 3-4-7) TaxID=747676 RepID=F4SD13_MELLP|nr:uncharacterized protein MELLADRAFT_114322 [Melampsora larici-populina 98AG31]EGF97464.1 hypothetical protein MELLADRAFT_114322 [Melampsora larici-populina 98AG31]
MVIEEEPNRTTGRTESKKTSVLEGLCVRLREDHGLSAKQFFQNFMASKEESIIIRRKQWISPTGWKSTRGLLDSIKQLVDDENTAEARHDWQEWVLQQAIEIVNTQKTPRRNTATKKSAYVNATKLEDTFFNGSEENRRNAMLKDSMNFMWRLIEAKLEYSHHDQLSKDFDTDEADPEDSSSDFEGEFENELDDPDKDPTEHVEGRMYVRSKDKRVNLRNRLQAAVKKIRVVMSKKLVLSPVIVLDNIDIQERIHHERIEQQTQMYHGSWGYIHQSNPKLLKDLDTGAFSKDNIRHILQMTARKKIDLGLVMPTEDEQKCFKIEFLERGAT